MQNDRIQLTSRPISHLAFLNCGKYLFMSHLCKISEINLTKKVPNLFLYEKQAFSYDFHIKTKSTVQKAHIQLAIYNYLSRVWIRKKKKLVCKREMFNIYRVSTMTIVRLQPFICDIRKRFFFCCQNPYLFFTSFSLLWIEMFYRRNRNWFNNNLAVCMFRANCRSDCPEKMDSLLLFPNC